jgi:hypothetical protein
MCFHTISALQRLRQSPESINVEPFFFHTFISIRHDSISRIIYHHNHYSDIRMPFSPFTLMLQDYEIIKILVLRFIINNVRSRSNSTIKWTFSWKIKCETKEQLVNAGVCYIYFKKIIFVSLLYARAWYRCMANEKWKEKK